MYHKQKFKLAKARRGMIKEKEKGGGARLKDEPSDPAEPGHGSRPPSASLPTPAALKKEPEEPHRVKMEPHSQPEDSAPELGVDGIKTEIDGLMDSDGDPTKSPSCELGGPGSLKSERLSSDSNDILDPQTGLRGSTGNLQDGNQNCRNPNGGPENMGSCRMGGGGGPMGPGVSLGPMSASEAQTLPSNVISKQAGSMEQQSQIFVFSTLLANKGAEAVISGQHHSIIAYHCAQPGTKKYLEKHPLKMGQFNKQSPAQWLNNLAMAKNRGGMRGGPNMMGGPNQMGHMMGGPMGPNMGPMGHGGMGHMGPNMMGPNRMGGPGNQMMMMKGGPGQMGQMGPGMGPMDGFPGGTPSCGVMDGLGADGEMPWDTKNSSVMSNGMGNGPGQLPACSEAAGSQSDAPASAANDSSGDQACQGGPKGVKIPDENLTPQQRAHREEQLATIRKMQQMLFPESGGSNPGQGPDGSQPPNDINPPNSTAGMNMPFPPMSGMGPNGPMGSGPNGPMVSMPNSMNSGPSCTMAGPMGPNGPMGGPMGPNGPMGGPMGPGGPMGGMGGPGGMGMGHGSMGPNGMMGPNGPMMGGMGPNGPMGPMGPCGMKGIRSACGGPDMKGGMCADMHMGRGCGGPMGRMPNPMGGMGGPKPCMMGGPHMGPRMMPGPNLNAMNGGIMMDGSMMGGMVGHGDCGPEHHGMPVNGPMCDEYGRGRNMGPGDPGGLGPGVGMGVGHKGGMRSPKSPAGADIDWQKLHHQFFDDPKSMDTDLSTQVKSPCSERGGCLPPPPYGASPLHRSASVPIATQSPGHGSVQMPMSAEASRASSGLNSPAHCKPGPKQDAPEILEKLDEGVFVRTLQCLAAQQQKNQQGGHGKEPSLMPVPSPQQISYLNQFEGQELTIQKQPNTSLKDNGPPSNSGGQTPQSNSNQKSPAGMMPGTPEPHSSLSEQRAGRFSLEQSPGFNNPQTPTSAANSKCGQDEKSRPSPSSNRSSQDSASKTPQRESNLNQGPYAPTSSAASCASVKSSCSVASSTAPTTNSGGMDDSMAGNNETTLSGGPNSTSLPGPFPGPCSMNRPDNIPINPNQGPNGPMGTSTSSFDPISSLAQMSQQLTNTVGGGGPGPGPMGPNAGGMGPFGAAPHHMQHHHGMHPHSHPHMMMNELGCHMDNMGGPGMGGPMESMMGAGDFPPDMNLSPKMGGGPMGGPMGPMGPEAAMLGPRMGGGGKMPPFNGANVQVKPSAPNTIQYLPTRPQLPCSAGPRGPPSLEFLQRVTNPMQLEGKGAYFPRGMEEGMRGGMRAPMLRMPHHYPGGFGSPPKLPAESFGAAFRGVKGPVRMGAAQPLPPSVPGPAPAFKGQGFAVPSPQDPAYAAQFHNFQQQLYATGSRGAQPHQPYPPYQPPK
ncbi:collagen alpha-1(I) chain isoform X3 [Manduca sexta]|uniref:collagen alpha-1(I) chain isoform X3 n=1 Tax=Manduca sexta TaxID=7130 RepID=UPI00188F1455|nr:collagen alpha-1(I) chain isoform X3 [Manduca sexta]